MFWYWYWFWCIYLELYFQTKSLNIKCFLCHCLIRNEQEPPSLSYILSLCNSSDTYLSIYRVFFLLVLKVSFSSRFERKWFPLILSRNKFSKCLKFLNKQCLFAMSLSLSLSLFLSSCRSCHVSSSFWSIVRRVTCV